MQDSERNRNDRERYDRNDENNINDRGDDRYSDYNRGRYQRSNYNYRRGGRYSNRSFDRGQDDSRSHERDRNYERDSRYNHDEPRLRRGRRSYNNYDSFSKRYDNERVNYRNEERERSNIEQKPEFTREQRYTDYNLNEGQRQFQTRFDSPYHMSGFQNRGGQYNPGFRYQRANFIPRMPTYPQSGIFLMRSPGHDRMFDVSTVEALNKDAINFEELRLARAEAAKDARESLKEAKSKEQNTDLSSVIDKALASTVSNAFSKAKKQYGNREIQRRRSESFSKDFFQAHKDVQLKKKTIIVSTMAGLWSFKRDDLPACKIDESFKYIFNSYISASTNFPWVSETKGMFGRKSVRDMKFSKSESMNLLQISDRIQLIRSSVNSILNKLTPDTMNVLSSELVEVLTTNKDTKLKKPEELYMVTKLIVKNALLMHKYSPQLAMLCAILFGRINVQTTNFNDTLFESIFDEFIAAINSEETSERNIPETKGIYIFLANLYNAKVMSNEGIVDIITETTKKSKNPNFCLFLECLIQMATIITKKNGDVKPLQFDLIKEAIKEYIDSHDKTDITDRLKFRMLDLTNLIGGKVEKKDEKRIEKETDKLHDNEELKNMFVKWYKDENKTEVIKLNSKTKLFKDLQLMMFNLYIHLLDEDVQERKQLSTFLNSFWKAVANRKKFKISFLRSLAMVMMLRTDFELDYPNYFELIKEMFMGIDLDMIEGYNVKYNVQDTVLLQEIGYEVSESQSNIMDWLTELVKAIKGIN